MKRKVEYSLILLQKDDKIRVSGMLRIYWDIKTPIKLKSGQSIPLGNYHLRFLKSLFILFNRFVSKIIWDL